MERIAHDLILPEGTAVELFIDPPQTGGGMFSSAKQIQMERLNRMAKFDGKQEKDEALHVQVRIVLPSATSID